MPVEPPRVSEFELELRVVALEAILGVLATYIAESSASGRRDLVRRLERLRTDTYDGFPKILRVGERVATVRAYRRCLAASIAEIEATIAGKDRPRSPQGPY